MAVFAAPFAAAGVGAAYVVALSKTYSAAANFSAKQAFGIENAYPWPFWKTWFDSSTRSNGTSKGTIATCLLAAISFGAQRRLLWRHLGNSMRLPAAEQKEKITDTGQFVRIIGPGIAEFTANALATSAVVGFARPWIDGNNLGQTS